jgi:hypothetical protein
MTTPSRDHPVNQKNQFVLVIGPHRSGSSLVAAGLHSLGVNLGNQFIAPNEDNPKGFFEDEEIVRFNDRLLRNMNLSWDSFGFVWEMDFNTLKLQPYYNAAVALVLQRFDGVGAAGLKDPRFCLLLPFWKRVIAEALNVEVTCVLSLREPELCVLSQKTRHFKDSDFHLLGRRNVQTLLLWLTYVSRALAEVESERLIVVSYAALVAAPEIELQRLAKFLELDYSERDIESFCRDQVDPLLNRSIGRVAVKRSEYPLVWDLADRLYERLLAFSRCNSIHPDEFKQARECLDLEEFEPIYIKELQYMSAYSYKKIISLRHRLIQTIEEIVVERGKHDLLKSQYNMLADRYELLSANYQTVLNTRGWKLLVALRRLLTWRPG